MRKLLPIIIFVISVSSCSSTQTAEAGCKFVNGTYESEQKRKQNNERINRKHESDNVDVINGMLSLFTIQLSGEEEKCMSNK